MDALLSEAAFRHAETRPRCVAAQERAREVLSRAVIALKVADERLKRAQAAQARAMDARRFWARSDAAESAECQEGPWPDARDAVASIGK